MVRKIAEKIPDEVLQQDLEKYKQRALQLGTSGAKIITADMIIIDERVRAKCIIPFCNRYGTCANCPPYAVDLDLMRNVVNRFHYAIFTKLEIPPEKVATGSAASLGKEWGGRPYQRKTYEVVGKIETEAFFDGYYLAIGLASGSCRGNFCPDIECSAIISGKGCRFPLKARPSMEATGIDAYGLATKVGWDVYPIGESTLPSEVPYGLALGLVLIY